LSIKIDINNHIILSNISREFSDWLISKLTFDNPLFTEAMKHNRSTYNIPEHLKLYTLLPGGIQIPRGLLQTVEKLIINSNERVQIIDRRVFSPASFDSNIVLRNYQKPAEEGMLTHPNGMLVAPAGSGKTMLGLNMCALTNQKTLWLTHTKPLAKQVKDRILGTEDDVDIPPAFKNIDEKKDIGLLGAGKWKIGDKFTVGIVQTLVRNLDKLQDIGKEFGLVIVDEAHHVPASTFSKVIGYFSSYYLYGLTATPIRRDKMEPMMFAMMGDPNAVISREAVKREKGIITPTVIVREVPSAPHGGNEYHTIISELVMTNEYRQQMIVQDVVREAKEGHYCIVVTTRKEYCETLHDLIKPHHDKIGIADGDYTDKHNNEQVRLLANRDINVLITTINLLGEGFDVQHLDRGFFVLPFKWSGTVQQAVGRIQRSCEATNKQDAILYDYVDVDIGILKNQFKYRLEAYKTLGMNIQTN